jgi:HD-like signal output (HDOD) protein
MFVSASISASLTMSPEIEAKLKVFTLMRVSTMGLSRIFNGATKLPSVPKLVQELIESFQDEDAKIDDIAEKLAKDPVLTAKMLRMANSAQFGGRRKIASVNDAVILLGLNSLRSLVMASGVTGRLRLPSWF